MTTKSTRGYQDNAAILGVGATNVLGRLAASIGALQEIEPRFMSALDVPFGGVMLALPALLACGLLKDLDQHFQLPKGYYGLQSIFLLLAFMALARIKSIEDVRYSAPGEWGKLLGLDRIPEVKTLRDKIKYLAKNGKVTAWSAELCKQWMQAEIQATAVFYVDGHVRVYYGAQTQLPKHYVAREKLCLRATVDYWVNAMDGNPFFYVNKAIDPGLLQVLENDIIPRLEAEVPTQPSIEQLETNPYLHRFTIIFDREGYSPDFMKRMMVKRIACITYHKHPQGEWPKEEFSYYKLRNVAGNIIECQLAERGTYLSGKLWVREIRKLTNRGRQISILSTDFTSDLRVIAAEISNRWSQENFFKYMRQHYNLDRLIEYSLEQIPDTVTIVNPQYRAIDGKVRSVISKHSKLLSEFGAIQLKHEIEASVVDQYQLQKSSLQEEIQLMQIELEELKQQRKKIPRHILISELPENERFSQLASSGKNLLDTIKMVAYRAETSMVNILRQKMSHPDDGRKLLRAIYQTEVDLFPDKANNALIVSLHHLANHCSDDVTNYLCDEINNTDTIFPGTNLRLFFKMGSAQNPRVQVV